MVEGLNGRSLLKAESTTYRRHSAQDRGAFLRLFLSRPPAVAEEAMGTRRMWWTKAGKLVASLRSPSEASCPSHAVVYFGNNLTSRPFDSKDGNSYPEFMANRSRWRGSVSSLYINETKNHTSNSYKRQDRCWAYQVMEIKRTYSSKEKKIVRERVIIWQAYSPQS